MGADFKKLNWYKMVGSGLTHVSGDGAGHRWGLSLHVASHSKEDWPWLLHLEGQGAAKCENRSCRVPRDKAWKSHPIYSILLVKASQKFKLDSRGDETFTY